MPIREVERTIALEETAHDLRVLDVRPVPQRCADALRGQDVGCDASMSSTQIPDPYKEIVSNDEHLAGLGHSSQQRLAWCQR